MTREKGLLAKGTVMKSYSGLISRAVCLIHGPFSKRQLLRGEEAVNGTASPHPFQCAAASTNTPKRQQK